MRRPPAIEARTAPAGLIYPSLETNRAALLSTAERSIELVEDAQPLVY